MCRACKRLGIDPWADVRDDDNNQEPEEEEEEEEEEEKQDAPKRPRKQLATKAPKMRTVVQRAPSHDGVPIFAAYSVEAALLSSPKSNDEGGEKVRCEDNGDFILKSPYQHRPKFGIVIYDITPTASEIRAARLARSLFDRTLETRQGPGAFEDRIEVVALPLLHPISSSLSLTEPLTDRQSAEICIRHYEQEVQSRLAIQNVAEAASWFLPERIYDEWWAKSIIIITRLEEGKLPDWEAALRQDQDNWKLLTHENAVKSPYGSFLSVYWQPREEHLEKVYEVVFNADNRVHLNMIGLEFIGSELGTQGLGRDIKGFYDHFVLDGLLERELACARLK